MVGTQLGPDAAMPCVHVHRDGGTDLVENSTESTA
eukprot:COSAG01_NODE_34307_length_549_cov_25.393333_1_plen_34_part_10